MSRWEQMVAKEKSIIDHTAFIEQVPEARRRRSKKREKITDLDRLSIAYRVLVEKQYQAEVARAFRISTPWVS